MSSPTRRKILDRLRDGPKTTGELASRFPKLTRFAVMQHLGVLTKAHLVLVRREGRFRFNHLNAGSVVKISDSIFGNVSPDQAAKMDEGWRLLFDEGLRPYAERDSV